MALNDLLTIEAMLLALSVRQARHELNAAVSQAERELREKAR